MKKIILALMIAMTVQTVHAQREQGEEIRSNPERDKVYTNDFIRITPLEYRHYRFGKVEIPRINQHVYSLERERLNSPKFKQRLFRSKGTGQATMVVHVPWEKTGPEFKHPVQRRKIQEGTRPE